MGHKQTIHSLDRSPLKLPLAVNARPASLHLPASCPSYQQRKVRRAAARRAEQWSLSMMTRRVVVLLTMALCFAGSPALPSGIASKFTWEAFEAAQKEGKPILVEVFAGWCPVCRVQRPIIEDLAMGDRFKDVVYLEIDFDRQKDVLRKLNAQKQGTLIVFKGNKEVGRTTGDTDRVSIEGLIAKAM
jgi:thioredoxin 1